MHNLNKYTFKGWDYTELMTCWNLPEIELMNDDHIESSEYLSQFIQYALAAVALSPEEQPRFTRKALQNMRAYVDALIIASEGDAGYSEIWKGLQKISSDFVFTQMFCVLVGHMWT